MLYQCTLGMIMVAGGNCQTAMTPDQIVEALSRDLQGRRELAVNSGRDSEPERPAGESISLSRLKHRPPKTAKNAFSRGEKFAKHGEHQKAAEQLEIAVREDPDFASAHDFLGIEYAQLGRLAEARTSFERSIELDPLYWGAHFNLALALSMSGDFARAEPSARRAVELAASRAEAHLLLGELLCMHPETRAEAIGHLEFAARTIPAARIVITALKQPY